MWLFQKKKERTARTLTFALEREALRRRPPERFSEKRRSHFERNAPKLGLGRFAQAILAII
jgi:hypothetical protein